MTDQNAYKENDELKRAAERQHDRTDAYVEKMNEAAVQGANLAMRTVLLINGGAAASMLAFIGNIIAKGDATAQTKVPSLTHSLIWFASGVGLAAAATAFAYLTNYSNTANAANQKRDYIHPFDHSTDRSTLWKNASRIFHWSALAATLISLLVFVCGVIAIAYSM